jgi:hypothetical protein
MVFGAGGDVESIFDPEQFGVGQSAVKSYPRTARKRSMARVNEIRNRTIMPERPFARAAMTVVTAADGTGE